MTNRHPTSHILRITSGSLLLLMTLGQTRSLAHGGQDHGTDSKTKSNELPNPNSNPSTKPLDAASDKTSSWDNTQVEAAPQQQSSFPTPLPTFGLAESLFGLILIAPFGLTLLRRRAQHTRKSLRKPLP